jgi:hypothetical protein
MLVQTRTDTLLIKTAHPRQTVPRRLLFAVVSFLVVAPAIVQTWILRNQSGSDSIAYLDIARGWARGDWGTMQNGFWSPLYPAIVGAMLRLVAPGSYWEFASVHALDFALYLLSFGLFWFMLNSLMLWRHNRRRSDNPELLSDFEVRAIGCAFFACYSFRLVSVPRTNPDMLTGALVYLGVGLLLRLVSGSRNKWLPVAFGAALGAGYLAKTPMLIIGLALLVSFVIARPGGWAPCILAAVTFVIVAAPGVLLFSASQGRLSIGESGGLNYSWHVDGTPRFHWRGGEATGTPLHTTRTLSENPTIYEFSGRPGTYPIWFDPSYWNAGLKPRLNIRGQLKVMASSVATLFNFLVLAEGGVLVCLGLLCASDQWRQALGSVWFVLVPMLIGIVQFCFVHLELRYIAAPLVVLCATLFAVVPVSIGKTYHVAAVITLLLAVQVGAWTLSLVRENGLVVPRADRADHPQWKVADALVRAGVPQGAHVAYIHSRNRLYGDYDWAYLAHVQITSEIADADAFWQSGPDAIRRSETILQQHGIAAIIACEPPQPVTKQWTQLANREYYLRILAPSAPVYLPGQ